MASIEGKSRVIDINAITHSQGVSWAVTHFLPVYDPSIDLSIKEDSGTSNAYRAIPLDKLARPDGYSRFAFDGSVLPGTVSGMDTDISRIKGQKLFNLPSSLAYKLRRNCLPFGMLSSDTMVSEVDQLGMSPYNTVVSRQGGGFVAMPPVSQDHAEFFLASTESSSFGKAGRTVTLNDGSEFVVQPTADVADLSDSAMDFENRLYNSCSYHAERSPSDPLVAQGTIACRLAVHEDGGEMVFNKFLFFITARDEHGDLIGVPPKLFAECAFNRKYFLASNRSQLNGTNTAAMNAFECVVTIRVQIGTEVPLESITLNENQWVSNEVLLSNMPDNLRVWRQGFDPEHANPRISNPDANYFTDNSRLQSNYEHMFQQAYSGDVGVGICHPRARLHLKERTMSSARDGDEPTRDMFKGIYPHLRFSDKTSGAGIEFSYMDALLGEGEDNYDKDTSDVAGMLNLSPSGRLTESGISMFRNAYALGARGAMAFGENSRAVGESSIAFGEEARSLHERNIAIGWKSESNAYLGSAIGHESYAGELERLKGNSKIWPGRTKSASYAHGHMARSDSGYAAGVNAEARGFWYAQSWDSLDGVDTETSGGGSTKPSGTSTSGEVKHGHSCGCPVCTEAIGHLMLAAEYDCDPETELKLEEIVTRQFGNLFSYAIGKNVLSGSMSGAVGINVNTTAYSSTAIGRNIDLSHYYSMALGSDIHLPGSAGTANLVFGKNVRMATYYGNQGNTILGQQIEAARVKRSLIFAYGIDMNITRGSVENCIVNAISSKYLDLDNGFNWTSPNFIDISIKSKLKLTALSQTMYWNGVNIGIESDMTTQSVSVGVKNWDKGGQSYLFGRYLYGANLVAFGRDISANDCICFGRDFNDPEPVGDHKFGTLVGMNLSNLGGTIIGRFGNNDKKYYYTGKYCNNELNPVLTVAGGTSDISGGPGHLLELGRLNGFYDASTEVTWNNFGEKSDYIGIWNLTPKKSASGKRGVALPTTEDIWKKNNHTMMSGRLRGLINHGIGFIHLDKYTGVMLYSPRGEMTDNFVDKPGFINFAGMVGNVLGTPETEQGAKDNVIPFAKDENRGWKFNTISGILARWFKELNDHKDTDNDAKTALQNMKQCMEQYFVTVNNQTNNSNVSNQKEVTLKVLRTFNQDGGGEWTELTDEVRVVDGSNQGRKLKTSDLI